MANDIIFIGPVCEQWEKLKSRFPTAKRADDFEKARKKSFTKMFWIVWPDVEILPDFDFSYQPDEWSTQYTHVFKNGEHYDGIMLCSKHAKVSKKEIDYRFFTNKKEVDVVASTPLKYDIFYIDSYDEYLTALETSKTEMFWLVRPDVEVLDSFKFDWYYSHHNSYDRRQNHVFKNGEHYDGIILCSVHAPISKREIDYCFVVNKKEIDVVASEPKPFDVVFISYKEPNAEENYQQLKERAPNLKRVHGVKGIHQAHIEAAKLCDTTMFWVVDGDARVIEEFDFDYQVARWDQDCVHVWRSRNPINDLEYGYGGVKLLPRNLTLNVDVTSTDMTTSISYKFKAVPEVSNVTEFNTDEFSTWRSAFRECVKLASNSIRGQIDEETRARLNTWCTVGGDKHFGDYAIRGALSGREYGSTCVDSVQLGNINNYDWLYQRFLEENDTSK